MDFCSAAAHPKNLEGSGVELVRGDIMDIDLGRPLVKGATANLNPGRRKPSHGAVRATLLPIFAVNAVVSVVG